MITWLDYYVQGASELARAAGLGDFGGDDVAAMAVISAFQLGWLTKHENLQCIDSDDAMVATLNSCVHALAAHAIPQGVKQIVEMWGEDSYAQKLYTARAIRPAAALLETLRGARAPDTENWRKPLLEATWYFDMPDRALLIGPSLQLRAVFTQPTIWDTLAVVCILTDPGSSKIAGRFAWLWEQKEPVYGLHIPGVDPGIVREQLEHLLRLLVLYAQVADKAEFVPLPQVTARELAGLKPSKRRSRLKKSSLFTICELRPPKDRFGRQVSEASESEPAWRLDRAVEFGIR